MSSLLNQECNEGVRKRHRGSPLQGVPLCGHQNLWHKCWGCRQTQRNWNQLKIYWDKMTNWDTMKNTETTRDKLSHTETNWDKPRQTDAKWGAETNNDKIRRTGAWVKGEFFTLWLFSGDAITVGVPSWSHRGNRHGRWPLGGKVFKRSSFKLVWFWFEMLSSDPL